MPIPVTCRCGAAYHFKDDLADKLVRCSACGAELRVPPPATAPRPQADPAFDRDKFLLRQQHLAISEKYEVWDEQGRPILYIERPRYMARNYLAAFAGLLCGALVATVFGVLAAVAPWEPLSIFLIVLAILGFFAALLVVSVALTRKRHVSFYRDRTKGEPLLEILQDKKIQFLRATYTLKDRDGNLLARFSKSYWRDLFRKQWDCHGADGSILCVAKEDSVILALLRRLLGPFFGILRTNFLIFDGANGNVLGEFNRKFTILDRYVLDLQHDPGRSVDRRIAMSLGVLLDTGERR